MADDYLTRIKRVLDELESCCLANGFCAAPWSLGNAHRGNKQAILELRGPAKWSGAGPRKGDN